mmetsp:Transcript_7514/g.22255  ORF Transcript_7514/g.22255 Transcript_7514/m.22255 type:complete len:288 (-) Transcript_7514:11-874(-)
MSRLILALAFLGYSTAAPPPPTACYGDAPGGERWIFLQPEHTGTDTTVRWLRALGSKTCAHGHELTPADAPPNVTFAFLLVANPCAERRPGHARRGLPSFHRRVGTSPTRAPRTRRPLVKRVLTSAAFHKIISGSRAVFPNRTRADDVAAFNAWVAGLRRPPVRAQTDVVAGFPVKFVGYTATLAADLAAVARALGYASPPPLGASHCITSCEPGDKINENGNGYHHGPDAGAAARRDAELGAWYSTAAAARAVGWFGADFDAFGFDPDVRTSPLGPIRRVSKLERL